MKIKNITHEYIEFTNDKKLTYHHDQDCCEYNYADFPILRTYNLSVKTGKTIDIFDVEFPDTAVSILEATLVICSSYLVIATKTDIIQQICL